MLTSSANNAILHFGALTACADAMQNHTIWLTEWTESRPQRNQIDLEQHHVPSVAMMEWLESSISCFHSRPSLLCLSIGCCSGGVSDFFRSCWPNDDNFGHSNQLPNDSRLIPVQKGSLRFNQPPLQSRRLVMDTACIIELSWAMVIHWTMVMFGEEITELCLAAKVLYYNIHNDKSDLFGTVQTPGHLCDLI